MVLKRPLQIFNGFWGDHHHWIFFVGLTIAINSFSMVFHFSTIVFNGFRWFRTIGQTMRWFRWIVVVYLWSSLILLCSILCATVFWTQFTRLHICLHISSRAIYQASAGISLQFTRLSFARLYYIARISIIATQSPYSALDTGRVNALGLL